MTADERQWDYVIDYIRMWDHKPTVGDEPVVHALSPQR